ncbi:hypothetical protein ACRAWG_25755 [Methylobacterium sp. P31]
MREPSLAPEDVKQIARLALGLEGVAAAAPMHVARSVAELEHTVLHGDGRQMDDLPVFRGSFEQVAAQVGLVQPLHDQHDRTVPLVVQTRDQRPLIVLDRPAPIGL